MLLNIVTSNWRRNKIAMSTLIVVSSMQVGVHSMPDIPQCMLLAVHVYRGGRSYIYIDLIDPVY